MRVDRDSGLSLDCPICRSEGAYSWDNVRPNQWACAFIEAATTTTTTTTKAKEKKQKNVGVTSKDAILIALAYDEVADWAIGRENRVMSPLRAGSNGSNNEGMDRGEEIDVGVDAEDTEEWILDKIYSAQEIRESGVLCDSENCGLLACVRYVNIASTGSQQERWRGCLDCQLAEFGGWPETVEEYPGNTRAIMTISYRLYVAFACSNNPGSSHEFWPQLEILFPPTTLLQYYLAE